MKVYLELEDKNELGAIVQALKDLAMGVGNIGTPQCNPRWAEKALKRMSWWGEVEPLRPNQIRALASRLQEKAGAYTCAHCECVFQVTFDYLGFPTFCPECSLVWEKK